MNATTSPLRRILTSITGITLFAVLTLPIQLAAHDQGKEHLRYKLIDLGTFGGPSSYLAGSNGVNDAVNRVLNNQGTVVGWGDTPATDPFALTDCFSPFPANPECFLPLAFRWQKGVLTDLGTLLGGDASAAFWISDNGLIAGQARNGLVDPLVPGFVQIRAVLWKDGQAIDLGTLGGNQSSAFSVNNRGQVVGVAVNTIPDPFSFFATELRAFLWQDGAMQDLGTLGGPEAFALFVNERGQVAGMATTGFSPSPDPFICNFILIAHPFIWENGRMADLGTLGGSCASPMALNNRGQVVGTSDLAGDSTFHPFLWERGSLIDLGTLGGSFGMAEGINDSGEVVGWATNKNEAQLAFFWRSGVMTNLGTLNGDDCSVAWHINSKGQIVGISFPCANPVFPNFHGFLWQNGFMTDLNVFAPPGSTLATWGDGSVINDRGEIAGLRVLPDGDLHAFLLVPCGDGAEGCVDAVEGTGAASHTPAEATAQKQLTPQQISRIRALLMNRHRGFMPRTMQ